MIIVLVLGITVAAPPAAAAANRVPTIAMSIIHVVRGCHVWSKGSTQLGPRTTISVKPGTRLKLRMSCPMDFDLVQAAGPRLAIGKPRFIAGTTRTIEFRRAGVYKLVAKNVQSSDEVGLETLGDDHTLRLIVRVR